jgi:streptomycin 3"-adenylyltransferase
VYPVGRGEREQLHHVGSAAVSRAPSQEQLDQIMALVRDVLGPDLVGAYLVGSAVLGGLRPESDLDVLVVSRRRTTHEEKQHLVDRLLAITRPALATAWSSSKVISVRSRAWEDRI